MDTNIRYINDEQIYPINIISKYMRRNFIFNKKTYKQYFDLMLNITYDKLSISGIVIPIEYILSNNMFSGYGCEILDRFKKNFIEIYLKLLIYISKLSEI